jgi:hypothetical protein
MPSPGLLRYWFVLDTPPFSNPYFGVTAVNYADALELLQRKVFPGKEMPPVREVTEKVDVSSLDPGPVLPNRKAPNFRGILHPKGYAPQATNR